MKKRLVFTVVTARAWASEQRQLIEGIISEAFKMNTDIVILSNIYNASEYNSFIKSENSIYRLACSERHDGIIFTDDSFMNPELRERVTELIDKNGLPVVTVGTEPEHYIPVGNDTADDIRKITDHLIDVHGFSDIDILTGYEGHPEAECRVDGYRQSLEKHGIDFRKENVIYGDFWTGSGEKLAGEYASGKRRMPQAVICTNDYMAYALCDRLTEEGVHIPGDITVTGYEFTGDRTDHYPLLSTWQRNRYSLGRKAFRVLYSKVTGMVFSDTISTEGRFVSGDTCSCGACLKEVSAEVSERKKQNYFSSLNDTGMLEQFLTESENIQDLVSALNRHSYFIPDLSGLYLCLYDDWCVSADMRKHRDEKSEDTVCYNIADIYRENPPHIHFRSSMIFPDEIQHDTVPNAYYCCPVFFFDEEFGYMTVRYDKVMCFGESFRNWNRIAANALEFLRMKNDIDYLMQYRNLSEFRDSATGLSNRKGFMNEMNIALRNAASEYCIIWMLRIRGGADKAIRTPDEYDARTRLISGMTGILSRISSQSGGICGRDDENTFVVSFSVSDADQTADYICEKLSAELYGLQHENGIYAEDMYVTGIVTGKVSGNDFQEKYSQLLSRLENESSSDAVYAENTEYDSYRELRKRIFLSPEKNITAEDACRKFLLSSGHFRMRYREYFGISFHQDCIRLRMLLASYLLVSEKINIASVARKCGFENEKYFMQQFRKIKGCTPNQYRTKYIRNHNKSI